MTNSFYNPRLLNKMRTYRLKVESDTRFFFKLFHLIDNSDISIDLGLCLLKKKETGAAIVNYEDNFSDGDDLIDKKISMAEMDDVDDIDDIIDDDENLEYYKKYRSRHKKSLNINNLELKSGTYILIPYSFSIWKSNLYYFNELILLKTFMSLIRVRSHVILNFKERLGKLRNFQDCSSHFFNSLSDHERSQKL